MGDTQYTDLVIRGQNLSAQAFGEASASLKGMQAEAGTVGGRLTSVFGDLGASVKATALGFVSAQAILGVVQGGFRTLSAFVSSSVDSYGSAEAAAKKMTTALQAQGTATPAVIAQYGALATQFQKTTVYSDDLINEMQALLTQVGNVAPGEMEKALSAATNLAAGLGIDLRTATLMVAKASEENVVALRKAGVQLDETRVKGEGMSYILGEINQKFGGQAQSEIDTYAGKVKQLANEWDNFKEAVGRSIVEDPALQALLAHLKEGITGVGDSAGAYTPTITEWWARMSTGSSTLEGLVGWFNATEKAAAGLNAELGKMKPPTPEAFKPSADPFAGLMAEAKAQSEALIGQWKKEDEAAKKHAAAFDAVFGRISGSDATKQMRLLDETFRALAVSGQLTEQQIAKIVKEALALSAEGGQLTERLWAMVLATDALGPGLSKTELDLGKIGTQVDIVVPKLDAYLAALAHIATLSKTTTIGSVTLGKDDGIDIGKPIIPVGKLIGESLTAEMGKAFQQLPNMLIAALTGGGGVKGAAMGMGTLVGSTIGQHVGKLLGTFGGPWGAAIGALAGPLIGKIADMFGHKGRDAVKEFAASFGGFDAFHAMLGKELPEDAERLWIKFTQGTGRNNPEQAKATINEITAALDKQKTKTAEVAAAAAASAAAQQEALDAITAKYGEAVGKLTSELKSLQDSVAGEAEEEFMGIVETQQRARMAQIEDEKAKLELQRDIEIAAKKATFDEVYEAGKKRHDDLQDYYSGDPLEIPYYFRAGNTPGASPAGGGGSAAPGASASARAPQVIELRVGAKVLARTVIEEMPAIAGAYGAAVR